jgi:hypothetical protein
MEQFTHLTQPDSLSKKSAAICVSHVPLRPAVQEHYDQIALVTCVLFLTADLGDLR